MTKINTGEYLQDRLAEALANYVRFNRGFKYRFYDTKSARGAFLPAQPGDFFLLVPGGSILIECKSSASGTGLIPMAFKGKVGKNQIAKHRMWHRAGHPSLYLYLDLADGRIEWHRGQDVVNKNNQPIWVGHVNDLGASLMDVIGVAIKIKTEEAAYAFTNTIHTNEPKNFQHKAISAG